MLAGGKSIAMAQLCMGKSFPIPSIFILKKKKKICFPSENFHEQLEESLVRITSHTNLMKARQIYVCVRPGTWIWHSFKSHGSAPTLKVFLSILIDSILQLKNLSNKSFKEIHLLVLWKMFLVTPCVFNRICLYLCCIFSHFFSVDYFNMHQIVQVFQATK